MTDLERARAHLLYEQRCLAAARRIAGLKPASLRAFESAFLAALIWVWEEQEKAADNALNEWWLLQCEGHRRLHEETT